MQRSVRGSWVQLSADPGSCYRCLFSLPANQAVTTQQEKQSNPCKVLSRATGTLDPRGISQRQVMQGVIGEPTSNRDLPETSVRPRMFFSFSWPC